MLRITTKNEMQVLTFELEGKLGGPWVAELRDCWQCRVMGRPSLVRVDLRSVTFVDAAGKKLLAEMVQQGAKLLAHDCQMNAVVAEIESPNTETL